MNKKIEQKVNIEPSWFKELSEEFDKSYFKSLKQFLIQEKKQHTIFPSGNEIFNAYNLTPFNKVKVVILGQDPYHGEHQAHGLCFSVKKGIKPPPSLTNIYKELNSDVQIKPPNHGDLSKWAAQGVFLLNTVLTVRKGQPGSHQNMGWENLTDATIKILNSKLNNLVFLLWGKFAQNKSSLINPNRHCVLQAPHPSPFSAHKGFLGCKHFSKTNDFLISKNKTPINWQID